MKTFDNEIFTYQFVNSKAKCVIKPACVTEVIEYILLKMKVLNYVQIYLKIWVINIKA